MQLELEQLRCEHQQWTALAQLQAHHPQFGLLGYVTYYQGQHFINVAGLSVRESFRRQGVASWLMRQLEDRFCGQIIHHGFRTADGVAWATHFYGMPPQHSLFTRDGHGVPATQELLDQVGV